MNRWLAILFFSLTLAGLAQEAAPKTVSARFTVVDVYVDAGDKPLAAYQLDFRATNANAKIVGIEGGEHPAFKAPPFYDPLAMQQERVIIAAFSTAAADKLPRGKTRIVTIHFQTSGSEPLSGSVKLVTAGSADGHKIKATATWEERKMK